MTAKLLNSLILITLTSCLMMTGCGKDDTEPTGQYCLLTKSYVQGDTSQSSINFFYDGNDRVSKIVYPSPPGSTFGSNISYGNNSVTITDICKSQ